MDRRIIKTKRDIRNAFLELRSSHSVDKIKVSELCDRALINKSTFYHYYPDIYALSAEMDRSIVDDVIGDFQEIDTLFSDPSAFLSGMERAAEAHADEIRIVYGGRMEDLVSGLEKKLREYYRTDSGDAQRDILISFLIGGATHAMMDPDLKHELVPENLERYLTILMRAQ